MPAQIKTISDKTSFENVLNKFFKDKDVFLKTGNGDLKISFQKYDKENAEFKIPYIKNLNGNCLAFTRDGNYTIRAYLKYISKQDNNIFQFIIDKFQIIYMARSEERKSLEALYHEDSKKIIHVTNLISYSIIENSLLLETKKIDRVRDYVLEQMAEAFHSVKVFFCFEKKDDSRMKYFFTNKKPIFIPKINTMQEPGTESGNFYLNDIYSKDFFLQSRKDLISESTVPLLYKLLIPYGYIQCNNSFIITSSTLVIVKKFTLLIDEILKKEQVFPQSDDKLIVTNISKNGIGIAFKERKLIRYFKENNYVYFNLLLPDTKTASMAVIVRNIAIMENKIIKVGCLIKDIQGMTEAEYGEFLNSLPFSEDKHETQQPLPEAASQQQSSQPSEEAAEKAVDIEEQKSSETSAGKQSHKDIKAVKIIAKPPIKFQSQPSEQR